MKIQYSIEELEQLEQCRWLTDREREVFELYYRRGWEIEAIAAELYTCRSTINNVLKSIREKKKHIK